MMFTGWHYFVRPCRNGVSGWIAMAKQSPFVTDGNALTEPGPLWFEFGMDEADARAKIEREIRGMLH